MGVSFKIDNKGVIKTFEDMEKLPDTLLERTYRYFKSVTPIRSGNARNNTVVDRQNLEITADYPYAGRLDDGYSKQAPRGMVEPTLSYMERIWRDIVER